jgi:GNAT superfamily N-acetyltransferase
MSELAIVELQGEAIRSRLDELADVRIAVFREWPYLYEGTREYEAKYLDVYLRSPRSFVALVYDGARCVGATTAIPLADAGGEAQQPFRDAGLAIDTIDYFGESVLLPAYRGRGLGVKFFELREAHARRYGLSACAFCAVERPDNHVARPPNYVANDKFWLRRGYRKMPALRTTFSWPDIGETESTAKPMVFWSRPISSEPSYNRGS